MAEFLVLRKKFTGGSKHASFNANCSDGFVYFSNAQHVWNWRWLYYQTLQRQITVWKQNSLWFQLRLGAICNAFLPTISQENRPIRWRHHSLNCHPYELITQTTSNHGRYEWGSDITNWGMLHLSWRDTKLQFSSSADYEWLIYYMMTLNSLIWRIYFKTENDAAAMRRVKCMHNRYFNCHGIGGMISYCKIKPYSW